MIGPDISVAERPEYGETWVFEGIIGAIPGLELDPRVALAAQFLVFEIAVLWLGWFYRLPGAVVAGTVAVAVATAGSGAMIRIGGRVRREPIPAPYQRLLFGSNIEVVLAVFLFCGLITYIFTIDGQVAGTTLFESLYSGVPPAPVTFLTLLILWDVCYRIGAGWWASCAALYRSVSFRFDADMSRQLRRADVETAGFGLLQLAFLPFVTTHPILFVAVAGHVVTVLILTLLSIVLLTTRKNETETPYSDS